MKTFVRRAAVVIGAVAVSAGLIGASVAPAQAAEDDAVKVASFKDTSWGR